MEMRRLTATLLGIAVAAIILALAIPHWGCGNLLEGCARGYDRDAMIAVAALLIIGLACLIVVFIIDLVLICSSVTMCKENSYIYRAMAVGQEAFLIAIPKLDRSVVAASASWAP
ncbi:unnamed protein product [Dibothriocephalus latus]|uniref:Uncharacterized protein n=1 Tax=Dibothriocephalus latus TaxID=60516 RepID=A0A3P7QDB5_DIBLA|nr:unnamed protein product [Dibothriocephalus latus]